MSTEVLWCPEHGAQLYSLSSSAGKCKECFWGVGGESKLTELGTRQMVAVDDLLGDEVVLALTVLIRDFDTAISGRAALSQDIDYHVRKARNWITLILEKL